MSELNKPTFCLITGASRGLGKEISLTFASKFGKNSVFLLVSRDNDKLKETADQMKQISPDINVNVIAQNLETVTYPQCTEWLKSAISADLSKFESIILVHNAGTLGDLTKSASQFDDMVVLQKYFDLNLNSAIVLTTAFVNYFKNSNVQKQIIHITSLAALQPFKGLPLYCAGKAAREMYFRVLAEEEPDINVLNYSPGPLDTDMVAEAVEIGPRNLREYFTSLKADGKLLKCETTVAKLIKILEIKKYKSGDHIDYYTDLESA